MITRVILIFCFLLSSTGIAAGEQKAYEMPRTQVVPLEDSQLQRQYELYIRLPENYSENSEVKYPVIYSTDAVWHMDMLAGTTEYMLPNVIVVGISWQTDLGNEKPFFSRFRDYSIIPSTDIEEQTQYQFGQADRHLSFIRNDVIKYVETHYRADPNERAYFGYSLGGVFGVYALLVKPDTFKDYILGSPAIGERSLEYIKELAAKTTRQSESIQTNAYVTIGELEKSKMDIIQDLMAILQQRQNTGLSLEDLEIIEASNHATAFPPTTLRSIRWLGQLKSE